MLLLLMILTPIISGVAVSMIPAEKITRNQRRFYYILTLAATDLFALAAVIQNDSLKLFPLAGNLNLYFHIDTISVFFLCPALTLYTLVCFYAFEYMLIEGREESFFAFYFLSFGAVLAACSAGNLITLYLCFEFATLSSMPMVLHERTPEAIAAALKYLFYSIGGALMGLLAVVVLSYYGGDAANDFIPGGFLNPEILSGHETLLRNIVFIGVIGFGAKAGFYPLHGWLPTAHPIAPAPASALLSGIIAKMGILAVLRLVFFSAGADLLRGSSIQALWICLSMLTIFMGSMMAWREKVMKKRLAYSSVSQIAYIMLGLSLLNENGLKGGLIQLFAHAASKGALFLCAGAFIYASGKRQVRELRGMGSDMPVIFQSFLVASLSLIGIPPMGGFVSKWHIALAALDNQDSVGVILSILPPVILMLSALLTAGYLLPVVIDAFFVPEQDKQDKKTQEQMQAQTQNQPSLWMSVPIAILCAAALAVGLFGSVFTNQIDMTGLF